MLSPCGHAARHVVLSSLGAIVLVSGCAGAGPDTRRRLDELEQQLVSVQNRDDRIEERVAALEVALEAEHARTPPAALEQPAADEHGPKLPVVKLAPDTEEPFDSDPPPDVLESESANQSPGDPAAGGRLDSDPAPNKTKQGGSNKAGKKSAAPAPDKPREVIKVHGDGSQSRLSAPESGAPSEEQSTCTV
ncbi:MAG: hypothetical protein JW940_19770 [Polyangiaceae bacterium]|nr:hypothetical protein [Polyangiaceae bacterium]